MFSQRTLTVALVPLAVALVIILLVNLPAKVADATTAPARCQCVSGALDRAVTQDSIAHCVCGNLDCVAILPPASSSNHETSSLVCK